MEGRVPASDAARGLSQTTTPVRSRGAVRAAFAMAVDPVATDQVPSFSSNSTTAAPLTRKAL